MSAPKSSVRYIVSAPIHAVKLEDHPGSSLRNPTEILIKIPADAVIELEGSVGPSGLVTILWNGGAFSVFFEDLEEKAQKVTATAP
ncbi:MAG TPA: hypothetical protein VGV35_09010 [Bryobacteraceae bacterium]|nr:hypothetical protein [Bryobacteraceae bacterium]